MPTLSGQASGPARRHVPHARGRLAVGDDDARCRVVDEDPRLLGLAPVGGHGAVVRLVDVRHRTAFAERKQLEFAARAGGARNDHDRILLGQHPVVRERGAVGQDERGEFGARARVEFRHAVDPAGLASDQAQALAARRQAGVDDVHRVAELVGRGQLDREHEPVPGKRPDVGGALMGADDQEFAPRVEPQRFHRVVLLAAAPRLLAHGVQKPARAGVPELDLAVAMAGDQLAPVPGEQAGIDEGAACEAAEQTPGGRIPQRHDRGRPARILDGDETAVRREGDPVGLGGVEQVADSGDRGCILAGGGRSGRDGDGGEPRAHRREAFLVQSHRGLSRGSCAGAAGKGARVDFAWSIRPARRFIRAAWPPSSSADRMNLPRSPQSRKHDGIAPARNRGCGRRGSGAGDRMRMCGSSQIPPGKSATLCRL